jgi:hypothetical protein
MPQAANVSQFGAPPQNENRHFGDEQQEPLYNNVIPFATGMAAGQATHDISQADTQEQIQSNHPDDINNDDVTFIPPSPQPVQATPKADEEHDEMDVPPALPVPKKQC